MKKNIKKLIFLIIIVGFLFLFSSIVNVEAKRGCCSHHGGVCTYKCADDVSVGHCCCDGSSLSTTCAPYYTGCPSALMPKLELTKQKIDYTILTTADVEVTRVIDGDTIEVKFIDGIIEKVRLIGIDTPETVHPSKPVECFGKEASTKMKELVEGKIVRLERKAEENRGGYGRLLRYIYIDNFFVNAEMIKQGFAYAYIKYPFDSNLMEEFKQYEREARENEIGLWSPNTCDGVATSIILVEKDGQFLADISEKVEISKNIEKKWASENNKLVWMLFLFGIGIVIYYMVRKKSK